ncbi:MAG TPA: hemerythrin domain-containing protein [Kofleriaceae bacterium]|nr:hemerythrin domain-containing protein [Kofleriaceae bacterium]
MANPIDILAAKTKGFEKSMEAHRDGLIGVFRTLAKQHGEASALIDRIKNDAGKRESLWPKLRVALMAHEHGELDAVYPALERYHALKPLAQQHGEEAKQLEATIQRLDSMTIDSDEWGSVFGTLADMITSHVAEEENEIFPVSLNAIGTDRANDLDTAFKAAHKKAEADAERTTH